ncbi:MAG: lysine 2,3-aminomutase [Elusimicrobia bacterium RIFOXYC2_FULL_34_12]|nr:MAG: lysine 2,3-aminomutase [Elusimicrobia bacterium RIFOXYC2_FULL_34_12]OGS38900.1 MAG: lysine 2,3-aminomutase [Elusimicrobia bacterium RIFOXYD2_FULL_34_30]
MNDENLSSENGWHHQLKSRINNVEKLSKLISLSDSELKALGNSSRLKMSITPHFLSLIDKNNTNCPLRKQAIPTSQELNISEDDLSDPCGEERDMVVNGLVHRYPDRVLLLVTNLCAMYCRHCTRRRLTNKKETSLSQEHLDNAYSYIKKNKKIRDVLISGGDPLILSDEKIESILKSLRAIEHIEIIRIGTRIPVVLPQRITPQLVSTLKKYHPLYISIHFNHSKEISKETKIACEMLADAGIPLGSQTVLLKGINDNTKVMMNLMHELLKIRVKPYYIYQCDLAPGTAHFRTTVATGIKIIESLRGYTTGYAVPEYVIDAPGGGGKVPISPEYIISKSKGNIIIKNWKNEIYVYPENKQTRVSREEIFIEKGVR